MTTTLTTIIQPANMVPGLKVAVYSIAFDTVYPTGGEAIDLSADFTKIYAIVPGGNDTLADNGYKFTALFTHTATPSASNTLLTCWVNYDPGGGGAADRVDIEAIATGIKDLSAIGAFCFMVFGK